jgi:KDO2-lipid IV(A) lauroyltransferase
VRLEEVAIELTRAPEPPAPPLAALWRGGAAAWLGYHVADRLEGWGQVALFHILRHLPPEAAAATGRGLAPIAAWRDRNRVWVAQMRRTAARIRPDLDAAGLDALLAAWWRQAGMSHALYPCLNALARPGRLTVHGAERLAAVAADPRPTIYLCVHLGSWELIIDVMAGRLPRPAFVIYQPQPSRFQNRLIWRRRTDLGVYAFPPSRTLPRLILALIEGGTDAVIFIDEVSEGRSKFPLWGRPLPDHCNLSFALKLAHRTGARLQPCHFLREGPGRASFHLLPPIESPPEPDRDGWVRRTALALDALFAPPIRAHAEQWYMLKDARLAAG